MKHATRDTILLIGASVWEVKGLHQYQKDEFGMFYPKPKYRLCFQATDLEKKILGTETPERLETIHLPQAIFYAGSIIDFEGEEYYDPDAIERTIYGTIPSALEEAMPYIEFVDFDD